MSRSAAYVLPDISLPALQIKPLILEAKSALVHTCPPQERGIQLARSLSSFHADVIRGAWHQIFGESPGVSAAGLGSFGRREMNIGSDIDIQIVYDHSCVKRLAELREKVRVFVKFLWDIGVDTGHSLRSLEDCVDMAGQDIDVKTSFLESMFIAGDAGSYSALMARLRERVFSKDVDDFIRRRLELSSSRHKRHGDSERILEPHLKDGVGMLRDVHTALWLKQVISNDPPDEGRCMTEQTVARFRADGDLDDQRAAEWIRSFDFVLVVRNALHSIHRRKMDVLDYVSQAMVADSLGYVLDGRPEGVERFMRDFYFRATCIRRTCSLLFGKLRAQKVRDGGRLEQLEEGFGIRRLGDTPQLIFDGDFREAAGVKPVLLVRIFKYAVEYNVEWSAALEVEFSESLDLVDDEFRRSTMVAREFLDLWRFEGSVGKCLHWMHRLGFLERYLPEFGFVVAHYHYNVYHRFTTDEHLVVAVNKLEEIFHQDYPESTPLHHLKQVYEELSLFEKYQLAWAVFLHDIGKGRPGDHCIEGVRQARSIFDRIGFPETREAVYFLIEHHLRMEQAAFRRNLKDDETIEEFGGLVGDRRILRMLYLLTYADMSAANLTVWTDWKGALLKELFLKTDQFLRQRDRPKDISHEGFDWESATTDELMIDAPLKVLFNDGSTYTEVLVMTYDRPYRLSQICGAMAVNDVSILEANVHTRREGLVADEFRVVTFPSHQPLDAEQKSSLERGLREVLIGEKNVSADMDRLRSRWKRIKPGLPSETEILFDENRTFTIIDIFTSDRIGLLYLITKTLSDLHLNIHTAKIGTRLDGVADCFYILERDGGKLHGPDRQKEVRQRLVEVLAVPSI